MRRAGLIALATVALTPIAHPGAQQAVPDLSLHNARIYTAAGRPINASAGWKR